MLIKEIDQIIRILEKKLPASISANSKYVDALKKSMAEYFDTLEKAFPYHKLAELYYKNVKEGGPGSGNFGQAGRPGEVGGSGTGGGGGSSGGGSGRSGGGRSGSAKAAPKGTDKSAGSAKDTPKVSGKSEDDSSGRSGGKSGKEWADSVTEDEKSVIHSWQAGDAYDLRAYQAGEPLEDLTPQQAKGALAKFDSALNKDGSYEGTVYRGLNNLDDESFDSIVNSKTIEMKSHSSASKDLTQAKAFTQGSKGKSVLFKIQSKTAVDIEAVSHKVWAAQKEVILKKGTAYKVTGQSKSGGVTVLHLEEK